MGDELPGVLAVHLPSRILLPSILRHGSCPSFTCFHEGGIVKNRISIGAGAMLALMLGSGSAGAQFTTAIAPRRAAEAPPAVVAEQARQRNDSVAKETLTDMKAWVDSAASTIAAVPRPAVQDSVGTGMAAGPDTAARRTSRASSGDVAFQEGAKAPDTATPLPLMLVLGFGAVGAGLVLLRRSEQPTSLLQWARRARRSARRS